MLSVTVFTSFFYCQAFVLPYSSSQRHISNFQKVHLHLLFPLFTEYISLCWLSSLCILLYSLMLSTFSHTGHLLYINVSASHLYPYFLHLSVMLSMPSLIMPFLLFLFPFSYSLSITLTSTSAIKAMKKSSHNSTNLFFIFHLQLHTYLIN